MSSPSKIVSGKPGPRPKLSKTSHPAAIEPPKSAPRPRLKTSKTTTVSVAKAESPPATYAEVLATPSPPRRTLAHPRPPRTPQPAASPVPSVIELNSSPSESPPPVAVKRIKAVHLPRVPFSRSSEARVTRSSNGISKKRVLEDAAIFTDQEGSALLPSRKQKRRKVSSPAPMTPPRMPTSRSGSSKTRMKQMGPLASDFSASDKTPSRSISVELRNKKSSSQSASRSLNKDPVTRLSISPFKLPSVEEVEEVELVNGSTSSGTLLPSAHILSSSREEETFANVAGFKEWQEKETQRYSVLKARSRSASERLEADRDRSASPMNWTPSPPREKTSRRKGKGRAVPAKEALASGDEEDHPRSETAASLKKARNFSTPSSSSKVAGSSGSTPLRKLNSFAAALAEKGVTVETALEKVGKGSPSKQQYLADLNGFCLSSLPEVCEVTSPDSQDVLLADDYPGLPNLKAGSFRSWSSSMGNGYVYFSGWATQLPSLDVDDALAAIRFIHHKHFVNMSRVSPLDVHSVFTSHDSSKSVLHSGQRMAICLSPILVVESHLLTPTDKGLFNKFIKGTLHEQEMQRLVGATCMSFGHPILHAQIERDNMIFATNGSWKSVSRNSGGTTPITDYIRSSALLGKSPRKGQGLSNKQILDVTDIVPIYDAREHQFDYANDLELIDSVLPRFDGEIPAGSFAVVAYTMSTYKKGPNHHLSTNVQFVILLKEYE